jgi:hypothetical protein
MYEYTLNFKINFTPCTPNSTSSSYAVGFCAGRVGVLFDRGELLNMRVSQADFLEMTADDGE